MLWSKVPPAQDLQTLGVRRLSSGGSPFASAYTSLAKSVTAYLRDGDAGAFTGGPEMGNLNKRFGT